MTTWEPVIGLEVHAQLKTASKLFCGCPSSFGGAPNHHACPLCLGMPGTLPVLNARAVEAAIQLGLAVGATVNHRSVFSRKNYFYPDLPKGYQISQYDLPICSGGRIEVETKDRGRRLIRLCRIHMEEDAGMSSHEPGGTASLVDLNRAGVPLCEIVTEADVRSSDEAMAWMKALRSILRYLEVSDGNMEEGSFRCDANISMRPAGREAFGTKVEIKNLNSFRFVGQAIEYEMRRQVGILEAGQEVQQQTRRFDSRRGVTVFMRGKEDAHDYRYFPEPDLLVLNLDPARVAEIGATLPELGAARAERYQRDWELSAYDAGVLTSDRGLAEWFERAVEATDGSANRVKAVANWTMGELLRLVGENGGDTSCIPFPPSRIADLVALIADGVISSGTGKQVLSEMWSRGDIDPSEIVDSKGWRQVSDTSAIDAAIQAALDGNPDQLEQYRAGKTKLRGFFVGQVMRAMKGKANPQLVQQRLDVLLEA